MLKRIFTFGEQARLIEELGGLQVRQAAVQCVFGQLGNSPQQGPGHVRANHGGGLEQVFVLWREAVDARCQDGLHGGRHRYPLEGLCQPIGPWSACESPRLDQGPYALFQKEGIAFRASNQEGLERPQAGIIAEQGVQELVGTGGRQRVQPQLRVVRLAAPAVLILRPVVDQEQDLRHGQALDQAVEQRLCLGVDPV
jgi:hypothetical protein